MCGNAAIPQVAGRPPSAAPRRGSGQSGPVLDRQAQELHRPWAWMLDLPHQPDEYGDVEDMLDAATVLGLALGDLLGTGGGG